MEADGSNKSVGTRILRRKKGVYILRKIRYQLIKVLSVLSLFLNVTPGSGANEPVPVKLLWEGELDFNLISERPLPSKYANNRLVKLGNINHDQKDDIVYVDGGQQTHLMGFDGHPAGYTWDGDTFRQVTTYEKCELRDVYDFACHKLGIWTGQGRDLTSCNFGSGTRYTYFSPGNTGLPIRTVNILQDPSGTLFLIGFISSVKITPGTIGERYKFVLFRHEEQFIKIAEVDFAFLSFHPTVVTADFNNDKADEIVISGPYGDSASFYYLVRDTSWHFERFLHAGAGRLHGAGDVDRDGRIELVASGYRYYKDDEPLGSGVWCFEWENGTFVFDRYISMPEDFARNPTMKNYLLLGNLIGDAVPELFYRNGNHVKVYGFE